jgi:hypothetical protein
MRRLLIQRYLALTKDSLPAMALSNGANWPIHSDHCFQRIVLDNIVGDAWYIYISSPAYLNMTEAQLKRSIDLCESLLNGSANIHLLQKRSLNWRKKQMRLPF